MKIDELLIGLGFDYDPKGLDKFSENIDAAKKTAMKMGKALLGVQAAVTALVTVSTKATDQQAKLAAEIGTTTEMLDGLMFAASRAGVDNLGSSLQDLAVRAAEAARGTGSGVEALSMLGVSATDSSGNLKDISSLMIEISGSMQGLDNFRQIALADKLGLRSSIKLLQQGPKEIRALVAEAQAIGVATREDAAIAARYQDSLTNLARITAQVSRVFSRTFAPILSDIAESITSLWKDNRDAIEGGITAVATAIKWLTIAGSAFVALKLAKVFGLLSLSLVKLASASALASGAMAIVPVLIIGAIAALVLAIQDAKTFFEGGDSFFGDAIKGSEEWGDSLLNVAAVLATISDTVEMISEGWGHIGDVIGKSSWENAKEVAKNMPGFLGDVSGLYTLEGDGLLQRMAANTEANKVLMSDGLERVTGRPRLQNRNTNIDKIDININGGADTAENIGRAVVNELQQATQELSTAVDQ